MTFLSAVVNVVDCSGIRRENRLSHALRVLPIIQTFSAYSHRSQKVLPCDLLMVWKPMLPSVIPASLCLLSLPHLPGPPPPGQQAPLASFAPYLDCLHTNPSTTSVEQRAKAYPTTPPFVSVVSLPPTFSTNTAPLSYSCTYHLSSCRPCPPSSRDAVNNHIKNGNFNWLHR